MQQLMTERDVAEILALSVRTVQNWRLRGVGPAYYKAGSSIRYREADVEAFLRPCISTSQDTEGVEV